MASNTHHGIDAAWRIESARPIACLAGIVRDIGLAEEFVQDALIAALDRWPESDVPEHLGAWLMATAKYRVIDLLRRSKLLDRQHGVLGRELKAQQEMVEPDLDTPVPEARSQDFTLIDFARKWPTLCP